MSRNILILTALLSLTGCLGTPITPKVMFEKSEPLPPYLVAKKYYDLIEKCWIEGEPDSNFELKVFPFTGLSDYKAKRLYVMVRPKPTPMTDPASILEIVIDEYVDNSESSLGLELMKTSIMKVETNANIYPKSSLRWVDIKRWSEGDLECVTSKVKCISPD